MAKFQTRRSISVNSSLFPRARDFAAKHGMPLARLAERALEAVLDGRLVLEPEAPRQRTDPVKPRGLVLRVATSEPPPPRLDLRLKPFCASCTGPTILDPADSRCATLEPFGRGGDLVTICHDCNDLPVDDKRYDLGNGASVKPGLGEGSRWSSSRGHVGR